MRSVHHSVADKMPLPQGRWDASLKDTPHAVWAQLSPFPSTASHNRAKLLGQHPLVVAFFEDVKSFSTNIVARREEHGGRGKASVLQWPPTVGQVCALSDCNRLRAVPLQTVTHCLIAIGYALFHCKRLRTV